MSFFLLDELISIHAMVFFEIPSYILRIISKVHVTAYLGVYIV